MTGAESACADLRVSTTGKAAAVRKALLQLHSEGYRTVALNNTVQGSVPRGHRCSLLPVDLSSNAEPENAPPRKKQKRAEKAVAAAAPAVQAKALKQLTRITVICATVADANALQLSEALQSYDIVAAQPSSAPAFTALCENPAIDIISLQHGNGRLPFFITRKQTTAALKRGIFFEVCYGLATKNKAARKSFIANTQQLTEVTKGRNLIMSGDWSNVSQCRKPPELEKLARLCGLTEARAHETVYANPQACLMRAEARRSRYKGVTLHAMQPGDAEMLTVPAKYYLSQTEGKSKDSDKNGTSDTQATAATTAAAAVVTEDGADVD